MPRLNSDDDFWDLCTRLAAKIGDHKRAIADAMLFRKIAQKRVASGKLVYRSDFVEHGLHPALIGELAEEVQGGGYIQKWNACEHNWLRKQKQGSAKGGQSRSPKKQAAARKNGATRRRDSNTLHPSSPKSLPLSLPTSSVVVAETSSPGKQKNATSFCKENSFNNNNKNWLAEIWDQCRGELPPVPELAPSQVERIAKFRDTPAEREKWRDAFRKIAASKVCNGKGRNKSLSANFDWAATLETRAKALQGRYSENDAPLRSNANVSGAFGAVAKLPSAAPSEVTARLGELIAALPGSRKKSVAETKKL